MGIRTRFLLVWILAAGSRIPVYPQTRVDGAFPMEGRPRRALSSLVALERGGGITLPQLNRVFDLAQAHGVEFIVGPSPRPRADAAGREGPLYALVVPVPVRTPRGYRRTFEILAGRPAVTDRYDGIIEDHARRNGLDARLVKAIVAAESEFDPRARSPRHARGLMQVTAPTAAEMGVPGERLEDPEQNIRAGAAYLRHLFRAAWRSFRLKGLGFHDAPMWVVQRVIAAYNAGPRALTARLWARQTRDYVRKVLLYYQTRITDIRRLPQRRGRLPEVAMATTPGLLD